MKCKYLLMVLIVLITNIFIAYGDTKIIKCTDTNQPLSDRWEWAVKQSDNSNRGFWIGFSIQRLMNKNSFMGSCYGSHPLKTPSLEMILHGVEINDPNNLEDIRGVTFQALDNFDRKNKYEEKILKEVAYLFYFDDDADEPKNINDIVISNLELYVNLKKRPLFWLGISSYEQSFEFLKQLYSEVKSKNIKEDLVTTIGLLKKTEGVEEFLIDVVRGDEHSDVREDAVYWIGRQDSENALEFLVETIHNDKSEELCEDAVYALSEMTIENATESLIEIARNAHNMEIRKKAIFWLGDKASRESTEILEEIIYDDEEIEVKEHAVYALSQSEDQGGITALIKIAKTHPSMAVRKKAIYWLGDSDDPRALDTIIDIIRNK